MIHFPLIADEADCRPADGCAEQSAIIPAFEAELIAVSQELERLRAELSAQWAATGNAREEAVEARENGSRTPDNRKS